MITSNYYSEYIRDFSGQGVPSGALDVILARLASL